MKGIKITTSGGPATPYIEPLLTPAEVAALFRVDTTTVNRWARTGKLTSLHTLGGHRRYREAEIHALLHGNQPAQPATPTTG